jgi:DNA replication protein DnaC
VTWQYGPEGVGIIGLPGKCKTRAGILILKRMAEEGRTVGFVTATKFSEMTVDQFSTDEDFREDARNQLRDLRNVDVLLFDDLGKGKITERAEVELYSLLEERTSHMLPTIWTANSQLKSMFGNMSDERSGAILRRLTEFSAIHTV